MIDTTKIFVQERGLEEHLARLRCAHQHLEVLAPSRGTALESTTDVLCRDCGGLLVSAGDTLEPMDQDLRPLYRRAVDAWRRERAEARR